VTTPPTKDDLIKLAEFELKRVEDMRREQGWTPWILWAAVAGLVWQIIGQVSGVIQWSSVAIFAAMLVLGADFLRSLFQLLTKSTTVSAQRQTPRVVSTSEWLSSSRPLLLFNLSKTALAAVIIFKSGTLIEPARYLWSFLYVASILGSLCLVIGTWVDWPMMIGASEGTWLGRVILAMVWLVQTIALGVMFYGVATLGHLRFGTEEARLAALIFGLSEVIGWLLGFKVNDPIRTRLVQIRRALAIGDISLDDAKNRLEVVLYGEEQSAALRTRIQDCLSQLELFTSRWETAVQSFSVLSAELQSPPQNLNESALGKRIASAKAERTAAGKALSRAQSRQRSFETRALLMGAQSIEPRPDLQALRESLQVQVSEAEKRDKELGQTLKTLDAEAEQLGEALRARATGSAI
jgi:hypothetical protein